MGETPTHLELLAGLAGAAVEHGVDGAGIFSASLDSRAAAWPRWTAVKGADGILAASVIDLI